MRPVGSTLTRPRSGEPDGPAAMNRPSSARRICVDLPGRARQPRHHLGGGEPQDRGDVGVVGEGLGDRRHPNPRRCSAATSVASPRLGGVDGGAFVGAVLGETERLTQTRHRLVAAEQLAGPQDRQHQIEFGLTRRAPARGCAGRRGSGHP